MAMILILLDISLLYASTAPAFPWSRSDAVVRQRESFESIVEMLAIVALGDMRTTPAACTTGKAAKASEEATPPTIAWTPYCWIRVVAPFRAATGSVCESTTWTVRFDPRIPPAVFTCSSRSWIAFAMFVPKKLSAPVRGKRAPIVGAGERTAGVPPGSRDPNTVPGNPMSPHVRKTRRKTRNRDWSIALARTASLRLVVRDGLDEGSLGRRLSHPLSARRG